MKYIISGTDRHDSNTFRVSQFIQKIYKDLGEDVEIIDLKEVKAHLHEGPFYGATATNDLKTYLQKIATSDGLIVVTPEYNGSMPGVLKYFIDHMKFPESFEYRPVAFVGLGGMFGGLRPVEHLQQIFGYRNAFIYPQRVFLINVWKLLDKAGVVQDQATLDLLKLQAQGFQAFTKALAQAKIDANHHLAKRA